MLCGAKICYLGFSAWHCRRRAGLIVTITKTSWRPKEGEHDLGWIKVREQRGSPPDVPRCADSERLPGSLTVSLDGSELPQESIKYAGVTPGSAGVYQINLLLPATLGANPEIRARMGDQTSRQGVVLPAQPAQP